MRQRLIAVACITVIAALASGCVEERVVHERPVVVERPVNREVVEVVAPRPPPERIVEVEQARPGYVWTRGYWHWNGREYVAVSGHLEPVRAGYHYVHPHWEQHRDGWHWRAGIWVAG